MQNRIIDIAMKDIKGYLHLYLGCECKIYGSDDFDRYWIRMVNETGLSICTDIDVSGKPIWWKSKDCKPILRPLSDMTEEEMKDFCFDEGMDKKDIISIEYCETFIACKYKHQKQTYVYNFNLDKIRADQFTFLLSKHFDLFNLIDEGLAIDKTKTSQQNAK